MRDNWVRVEGEKNLYKDVMSNGVIDTDTDAYQRHISMKKQRQAERSRVERLESRINNMESSLSDIQSLLTRLLERSNGNNN